MCLPGPDRLPAAAEALLEQVAKSAALQFPLDALTESADEVRHRINEQVDASAEISQVVSALERQYDTFVEPRRTGHCSRATNAQRRGARREFERFLADTPTISGTADGTA